MPYVVTHRQEHLDGWKPLSRVAVPTLDAARKAAAEPVLADMGRFGKSARSPLDLLEDCERLHELGGTIGPLPDGSVIDVEATTWVGLVMEARRREPSGYRIPVLPTVESTGGDPEAQQRILDAYNARQTVAA